MCTAQSNPKYTQLKIKSPAAKKDAEVEKKRWIQLVRKFQYQQKEVYSMYLKVNHTELLNKLHLIEYSIFYYETWEKARDTKKLIR